MSLAAGQSLLRHSKLRILKSCFGWRMATLPTLCKATHHPAISRTFCYSLLGIKSDKQDFTTSFLPTPVKKVNLLSPSAFSVLLGGGIISPECIARGKRCPSGFALEIKCRMSSTALGSNFAGIQTPSWFGLSRPPLGAIHKRRPPCMKTGSFCQLTEYIESLLLLH